MNRERVIARLTHIRGIQYRIWEEYRDKAKKDPFWAEMRDDYEMSVRALDYAMEAMRHDAI